MSAARAGAVPLLVRTLIFGLWEFKSKESSPRLFQISHGTVQTRADWTLVICPVSQVTVIGNTYCVDEVGDGAVPVQVKVLVVPLII